MTYQRQTEQEKIVGQLHEELVWMEGERLDKERNVTTRDRRLWRTIIVHGRHIVDAQLKMTLYFTFQIQRNTETERLAGSIFISVNSYGNDTNICERTENNNNNRKRSLPWRTITPTTYQLRYKRLDNTYAQYFLCLVVHRYYATQEVQLSKEGLENLTLTGHIENKREREITCNLPNEPVYIDRMTGFRNDNEKTNECETEDHTHHHHWKIWKDKMTY